MTYLFDFVIFAILIYSAFWMYTIVHSFFCEKKVKPLKLLFLIFFIITFITIFYGSFIEPKLITTTELSLNLNKTENKENVKIVFLADTHLGRYKKRTYTDLIVKKIKEQNPEIILLGGDYVLGKQESIQFLEPISELSKTTPTFAVWGNHEYNQGKYDDPSYSDKTQYIKPFFEKWNIQILNNQNQILTIDDQKLAILGTGELFCRQDDLSAALENLDQQTPKILISHNPDIILDSDIEKIDLTLSGHTHAGQIRLPWIGSIVQIPTELGRAYEYGLFQLNPGFLYVTNGLGESGARARLFNRPEIVTINLDL